MVRIQIYGYESYEAWVAAGCPGAVRSADRRVYTDWAEGRCEDCGAYRERMSEPCRTCAYHRPARYYIAAPSFTVRRVR